MELRKEQEEKIDKMKNIYLIPKNLKKTVDMMDVRYHRFLDMVKENQVEYYTQEGWNEWIKV